MHRQSSTYRVQKITLFLKKIFFEIFVISRLLRNISARKGLILLPIWRPVFCLKKSELKTKKFCSKQMERIEVMSWQILSLRSELKRRLFKIGMHSREGTDGNRFFISKLISLQPSGMSRTLRLLTNSSVFEILN